MLLAWALGLGFIQAGVRPAYEQRPEALPACASHCREEAGCDLPRENCPIVCLTWCATAGFHAVSEAETAACRPALAGVPLRFEDFLGQLRPLQPLPPPPRV